jgi:hypothetical protein
VGCSAAAGAHAANVMVSRCILLKWLGIALGHLTVLEQPASSVMQHHFRFQELIRNRRLWMSKHCLGMFGGESAKPIMLFASRPVMGNLDTFRVRTWNPVSEGICKYHTDSEGIRRSTGSDGLKGTQAYPRAFGEGVAQVFVQTRASLIQTTPLLADTPIDVAALFSGDLLDAWPDANLAVVLSRLETIACRVRPADAVR